MTQTTQKNIEQHQRLKLDLDDSEAFMNNALLNPTQPNQALKAAALRYKQVRAATHIEATNNYASSETLSLDRTKEALHGNFQIPQ